MRSKALISAVVSQRAEIEARTQSYLKALAELDASDEWRAEGYVSVEKCVAARTGAAIGAVCADLALARRLYGESACGLPLVAAAVESGQINLDHARAIERETRHLDSGVGADIESVVVEQAKRLAPGQLGNACERARRMVLAERKREDDAARARAERDAREARDLAQLEAIKHAEAAAAEAARAEAARIQQEHDSRYARRREMGRMTHIELLLPIVEAEVVWSVLTPLAEPRPMSLEDPDAQPDPRSHAQRFADAFVMLASRVKGVDHNQFVPGPIATINVIAEVTELGEIAYLANNKAVEPTELDRLMCDSEISVTVVRRTPHSGLDADALDQKLIAISPALGGTTFEVLEQGRSQRRFTTAQKKALRVRDRGCVYPGCNAPPEWCEAHHVEDWAKGGNTDIEDGALLCTKDHHQLHTMGWKLITYDKGASWHVDEGGG